MIQQDALLEGLGGRFGLFFFFCLGEGRGSPRCQEGGGSVLIENPSGGGVSQEKGGGAGGQGAGRVSAENPGGGGGQNIFFRGRNSHHDSDRIKQCLRASELRTCIKFLCSFLAC